MSETALQPKERKMRRSISRKTLLSILLIAFVLGITAIVIGYTVYSNTMDSHYLNNTSHLANTAAALVDRDVVEKYSVMIHERYLEATEEEREDQESEAYRSRFADIEDNEDYQRLRSTLITVKEKNDVMFTYIMVIDKARHVCLYVADGTDADDEFYSAPGIWEPIEDDQADSLQRGNEAVITNEPDFGWLSSGGSPIYVSDDGTFSAAIIDISMDKVMSDRQSFLINYCVTLLVVTAVLSALMAWNMRRQVVVPINKLAKAATQYSYDRAHHTDSRPVALNHFSGLNIRTGDELENLSTVMDDLETQLAEYIDDLTRVTAEKERIGAELNVATQIQADMLPRIFPAFPDRTEFDLYAMMHPAKEVGGDFYDFFLVDDDHLALVMADVSGKGVPAALFMVIAKTLIKNRVQMGGSPAEVLCSVNDQLCEGNEAELFVTVWLAVIEISTGRGVAANAGHEHPVLRRANGRYELVEYRHSPAVATMEGLRFREHAFELHPGDSLFVYTDGVPEATNAQNELFGTDRMLAALNRDPDAAPRNQLDAVRQDIRAFVGGAPQFDDITMLSLYYAGGGGKNTMNELTLEAKVENLEEVLGFVDRFLEKMKCPPKVQMQIDVAVEELFVNIASYAYTPNVGMATIRVDTAQDPAQVAVTFIDRGIPYDPLAKADPDITLPAEQRQIGGLGIYMVKKSMDKVEYEYRDGQNILTIRKAI